MWASWPLERSSGTGILLLKQKIFWWLHGIHTPWSIPFLYRNNFCICVEGLRGRTSQWFSLLWTGPGRCGMPTWQDSLKTLSSPYCLIGCVLSQRLTRLAVEIQVLKNRDISESVFPKMPKTRKSISCSIIGYGRHTSLDLLPSQERLHGVNYLLPAAGSGMGLPLSGSQHYQGGQVSALSVLF